MYGGKSLLEKIGAKFLETSTGDGLFEVNAVDKTFDGHFDLKD